MSQAEANDPKKPSPGPVPTGNPGTRGPTPPGPKKPPTGNYGTFSIDPDKKK